jgi:hypothetical protein
MAAPAIIGTAPREFPLGGTVSYSNWTFQLLSARVRWALGQASILDGRLHVCAKGRGPMGQEGGALLQSPTDTAAAALPEGPTQGTRRWTSAVERHLTGPACRHGCPLLDVAIGGDFNRVSHMALDRSKAIPAPPASQLRPPVKGQRARPPSEPPRPASPAEPANTWLSVLTCTEATAAAQRRRTAPTRCDAARRMS